MDWLRLLEIVIAFVGGGGLLALLTIPQAKKKGDAEAQDMAVAALNRAIEQLSQRTDRVEQMIIEKDRMIEEKGTRINDLCCTVTALQDDMCVHKGCRLRKPHQGQGARYYEDHKGDPLLGADYLPVETLIEMSDKAASLDINKDHIFPGGWRETDALLEDGEGRNN